MKTKGVLWVYGIVLICILTLHATKPVFAATQANLTFVGSSVGNNNPLALCNLGYFWVDIDIYFNTDDNDPNFPLLDFASVIATDANGVPLSAQLILGDVGTTTHLQSVNIPLGTANGAISDITARPITVKIIDISFGYSTGPLTQSVIYDRSVSSGAPTLAEIVVDPIFYLNYPSFSYFCGDIPYVITQPPVTPTETILPYNSSGDLWRLTPVQEAGNQFGLSIWRIDNNGKGYEAIYVTADELASLPDFPMENFLIDFTLDRYIQLYKLTSGEYQINIGPDIEGKVMEYIFIGIPPTKIYRREFNIHTVEN